MVRVPPPNKSTKGRPPELPDTVQNLDRPEGASLKPLNFKVSPEFHREIKTFAAVHDMSMVDVLREGFELIKKHRGG